jgi:uncharacterized protein (DUF4415 family)
MTISRKRLKEIASIKDSQIDYSDISELDDAFWKKAKLVMPENKKAISLRVDNDVLKWFKAKGKGYQSLMNAVLKTYVDAARKGLAK